MQQTGLKNPLAVARICARIESELEHLGYTVVVNNDMEALNTTVESCRSKTVSPMHNVTVCDFSGERAYWLCLEDSLGQTIAIQAFRCDQVETTLLDWCAPYMIGVYMRCHELMVPAQVQTTDNSISKKLRGKLVYHGELWVSKHTKNRRVFEAFTRLGLLLSMLKWNPDAIWALAGEQMAKHGHLNRIGYSNIERGFLRWEWSSDGVEPVEYLAVVDRAGLELLVEDTTATELVYQQLQTGTKYSLLESH